MRYAGILALLLMTGCVKPQSQAFVFSHNRVPWIKCIIVIDTTNTSQQEALGHVNKCKDVVEQNTKPKP